MSVTTSNVCAWIVKSNASWITVGSGSSGSGDGTVNDSVAANADPGARTGILTIAGQTFTVTQEGTGGGGTTGSESITLFVPIVISSSGLNNSFFTSEMTLTNRGSTNADLEFTYTAAFGKGSGSASASPSGGEQRIVPDAIAYLKSLGIPKAIRFSCQPLGWSRRIHDDFRRLSIL